MKGEKNKEEELKKIKKLSYIQKNNNKKNENQI
jgi:hypothetical protein